MCLLYGCLFYGALVKTGQKYNPYKLQVGQGTIVGGKILLHTSYLSTFEKKTILHK